MILAGDIGGTSTRLALCEALDGRPLAVIEKKYLSREYSGLGEIAAAFVAEQRVKVRRACFGIAGPVQHGRVVTPNLPWVVDAKLLAGELGLPAVKLINDLEATTLGLEALDAHDVGTTPGFGGDTARALASIRAATLVLAPPLDLYNPVEEARGAAAAIPGARFVEIPSILGHHAAGPADADAAAFLNREIAAFLAEAGT